MANAPLLEITPPGRDPYGMIGFEKLEENKDVLAGFAEDELDPPPVLVCEHEGVTFDDIRANDRDVRIFGVRFAKGRAVLFTIIADEDVPAGVYDITVNAESEGGYAVVKTLKLKVSRE